MTMVIDNHNRPYGGMGYDSNMYQNPMHAAAPPPHFTDPWAAHSSAGQTSSLYHTGLPAASLQAKQEPPRPTNISLPYSNIPTTTAQLATGSEYPTSTYPASESLSLSQDIPRTTYGTEQPSYTATAPPQPSSYAPSPYSSLNYAQSLQSHQAQQQEQQRRMSANADPNARAAQATFGELDSARGMLALSNQNLADLTPRNIYEARTQRGSTNSYGFPSNASTNSSFSMASGRDYPYYSASVASTDSATDYSSAASDAGYDSMTNSRTLPRPSQLIGANLPPAPQSMMSQFSSKMSNSTQKKHKCKVCDKRFTRPSSLQTHMYSHTGEKPFACDVEGCGRHFSVVSNLRRHKKVHKGEVVEHTSEDEE